MSEGRARRRQGIRGWLRGALDRCLGKAGLDPATRDFIGFCQKRWPRKPAEGKPLVLVHHSVANPLILSYAFIANWMARHQGAGLASFGFSRGERPLGKIYASFGAAPILEATHLKKFQPQADLLAAGIFAGLRSKRDVVNIAFEGVSLGDLIYDTHLRHHLCATIDLSDVRLRETISRAFQIYLACQALLERQPVAAVLTDHAVYLEGGVMARLALRRAIPVYHITLDPASIVRLDPELFHGAPGDPTGRPLGAGSCKLILPCHRFAELFATLPADRHAELISKGRAVIEERLSGAYNARVLPGGSAYGRTDDSQRLLQETGRPRILVMLHDFCDAPHAYRDLLFPDHFEWICWLLERAATTGFDWYVKPHPNSVHDPAKASVNKKALIELAARFPKAIFLADSVSNSQLIAEGLQALFTGYGTVGHEFAYQGIPVVNAGDNPHITYCFNHHPRSIEELAVLVENAATLSLDGSKAEIEEYAYMRFVHYFDTTVNPVSLLPEKALDSPEAFQRISSTEILRHVAHQTDSRETALDQYLTRHFAR